MNIIAKTNAKLITALSCAVAASACGAGSEENICAATSTSASGLRQTFNGLWSNGAMWGNGIKKNGAELMGSRLEAEVPVGEGSTIFIRAGGEEVELRIASVEEESGLTFYALTYEGNNICGEGGRGLFVDGVWNFVTGGRSDGVEVDGETYRVSFSCDSGILAKCVVAGYRPWEIGADAHQTCTRMMRADYCGDGIGHTKNGTPINIFDHLGVAGEEEVVDDMAFEAGWGPDGAVCVQKTRYDTEVVGQGPVVPSCWSELPRCSSFEEAEALGALIGNHSQYQSRLVCEPPAGTRYAALRKKPGRAN